MTIHTYPEMNAKIAGILRLGEPPSQYAAQRIEELEAEMIRLTRIETAARRYAAARSHGLALGILEHGVPGLREAAEELVAALAVGEQAEGAQ